MKFLYYLGPLKLVLEWVFRRMGRIVHRAESAG
jgi:hypothetical protein